jgi:hypothetical protein
MFPSIKSQYKRNFYVSFSSKFLPVRFNPIYNIQCIIGTQPKEQPAMLLHAPKHVFLVSKMFLTHKSITKKSCRLLYTILPMSAYYKKTSYPAVTSQNRTHLLCSCYVYYTRTRNIRTLSSPCNDKALPNYNTIIRVPCTKSDHCQTNKN